MGKKYVYLQVKTAHGSCEACNYQANRRVVSETPLAKEGEWHPDGCCYCGNDYQLKVDNTLVEVVE